MYFCKIVSVGLLLAGTIMLGSKASAKDTLSPAVCLTYDNQMKAEKAALSVLATSEMQKAREAAAQRWLGNWGETTKQSKALFAEALEEAAFGAALTTVVRETPPSTMVVIINTPQNRDGVRIPGTRYGWDNTDNLYGIIPVEPGGVYRISGQLSGPGTNLNLSFWSPEGVVLANIAKSDLGADADGRFVLTLGAGQAIGLPANADHILVRETMPDWATARPVYLEVTRIGEPKRPEASLRDMGSAAGTLLDERVSKLIEWHRSLYRQHGANVFIQPWLGRTDNGGLPSQAYSIGYFNLEEDEALVFHIRKSGAEYFSVQLSNVWGTSGDFVNNVSTLSNRQSYANEDGSFTYVVSRKDPGIQNWISTQGWQEGDIMLRWQNFVTKPGIAVHKVGLEGLAKALPKGIPAFGAADRAAQIAARALNPYGKWMDEGCAKPTPTQK